MKQGIYTIAEHTTLARDVRRMVLAGDTSALTRPGQFVNLLVEGCYLRRPISVADWDGESLTLIYKVVGRGTARLARMLPGERLDLLTGLGNGFDPAAGAGEALLVGGGAGVPPLIGLARRLRERGRGVTAVVGFNTACEAFGIEALQAAGARTIVATADGSLGVGGLVTDAIAAAHPAYGYFYACGPLPMLRALCQTLPTPGEVSLEERMGCGFGACMGCTCQTAGGPRRICLEGPVFRKEEIRWNEIPK
ncbi:dihydroorotate dehydrogenase electron transfer subunit [Alistipes sp.]|uniref:dihydroorotate dehydrogenase electron transfer subunit n=1 Tax=Alistipes sp. TaxID=1872444 RepID=UPI003AB2968B